MKKFTPPKQEDGCLIVSFSLLFTLLLLGMGVGGAYYSLDKFQKHINLVSNGIKTDGLITSYEEHWSKDDDGGYRKMYSPVISYYDSSNKSHTLYSDYSSSTRAWFRDVTVYFDKEDPSKAIRGGFWHLWFWPFVIFCLSMIPMAIGLFVLKYYVDLLFKKNNNNGII
ncbi:Protein of unknown function [Chryseobacterium ureilyticum]|uniref:DUF3592 domain-containing protein n=1 Tax=Chryseobacterium ureilyticum TaxID=373668 RepID=A0A1N7QPE1_9FLAO|nr:DUF3592 domain-containing protein [Chryseobacterium ureilyticum]SIT24634.1 Protein of unknown function [Chryseobacterium ureilyticum]